MEIPNTKQVFQGENFFKEAIDINFMELKIFYSANYYDHNDGSVPTAPTQRNDAEFTMSFKSNLSKIGDTFNRNSTGMGQRGSILRNQKKYV